MLESLSRLDLYDLIFIYYPILVGVLLWGAKRCKKGSWNDEFISLPQTKAFQGFCALCIMFHHIAQKTCASWVPARYMRHGLDMFVPIGYLLVGVFLFFSGFGLYKSWKTKPNYLYKFKRRRIYPPVFFGSIAAFAVMTARVHTGAGVVGLANPATIGGMVLNNDYAWYIYASVLFYLTFYLSFKYCKKERTALTVTCAVVVLYIVFCEWWMYGEWWYNTAPMFLAGIFFAKNEEKLVKAMKKHYAPALIISIVLFVRFFATAQHMQNILPTVQTDFQYHASRIIFTTSQMMAAAAFMFTMLLLGLKIKIGNKALTFMSAMTLEFYIIHGLFVELFGYCFMFDGVKPLWYIRNVALYVLVVFACTLASVYIMKQADRLVQWFVKKYNFVARDMRFDSKVAVVVTIAALAFLFIPTFIRGLREVPRFMAQGDQYQEDFNVYADVDGAKMSAYVKEYTKGESKHTIVIMRSMEDPCASITLRPLANSISGRGYDVIILDGLGAGFSDDTDRPRTADNIADETHAALESLGVDEPYILMPHGISGIYAQVYIEKYRDEVEALIAVETDVAQQLDKTLEHARISLPQYRRMYNKQIFLMENGKKFQNATGLYELMWSIYERNFMYLIKNFGTFGEYNEFFPLKSRYYEKYHNADSMEEYRNTIENYERVADMKYPDDLPVLTLISYAKCHAYEMEYLEWEQIHRDLITNEEIQDVRLVAGGPDFIYHLNLASHYIEIRIDEFIRTCLDGEVAEQ